MRTNDPYAQKQTVGVGWELECGKCKYHAPPAETPYEITVHSGTKEFICPKCGAFANHCVTLSRKDNIGPQYPFDNDPVNHPAHYTYGKYEVFDILTDWFPQNPLLWQTVKYLARCEHKGNMLQDLKKAQWYLAAEIKRIEEEAPHETNFT